MRDQNFFQTKIDPYSKSGRNLFLAFALLGLILILVGAVSVLRTARDLDALAKTEGTIVALDTKGSRPHKTTVEYEADGEKYTATLEKYYFTYKVGRQLPLAYDPANPADVQLAGFGRFLSEGLWGLAGLGFLIGSAAILYLCQLRPWLRKRREAAGSGEAR